MKRGCLVEKTVALAGGGEGIKARLGWGGGGRVKIEGMLPYCVALYLLQNRGNSGFLGTPV